MEIIEIRKTGERSYSGAVRLTVTHADLGAWEQPYIEFVCERLNDGRPKFTHFSIADCSAKMLEKFGFHAEQRIKKAIYHIASLETACGLILA